jgi:cellulose synthase/poly-beta-1,6-N-acetylglucosamine synthase-like glycosyltransferase
VTLSYVFITPAHNEEQFIELTIQSVIYQTILPKKWVIVDDGSNDRTAEIVRNYRLRMKGWQTRTFAGKTFFHHWLYECGRKKSLDGENQARERRLPPGKPSAVGSI